jgi:toxin YoeB
LRECGRESYFVRHFFQVSLNDLFGYIFIKAEKHIEAFERSGNKALLRKIVALTSELENNPCEGTGKPEMLKGDLSGLWSRRINREHRLVYSIDDNVVTVLVVSVKGHYES